MIRRRSYLLSVFAVTTFAVSLYAQGPAGFRLLEIKVVDDAGKPLDQATIGVTAADMEFPLAVDKEGIASLNLPSEAAYLALRASCPGYISLEIRWQKENIPKSFTFEMSKGQPIGGVVHDERGKPIAGVAVEGLLVSSQAASDGEVIPLVGGELAKTDAEGRWWADVATQDPLELRLKLSHEKFFSDLSFGKRRISNDQLRSLNHVEVMDDRIPPQGTVVDVSGAPVSEAELYVIEGYDKLTLENGEIADKSIRPTTLSDKDGQYQFAEQDDEFAVLCLAKNGWALDPERRYAKNEPVEIKLIPWAKVHGVVSEAGKPSGDQKLQLAVYYDDLTTDSGHVVWKNLATSNEKGEFDFVRLPNGFATIGGRVDYCVETPHARHDFSIEAQTSLQPGKSNIVPLNRQGLTVTGTVVPLRDGSEAAITCGRIVLEKEEGAGDIVRNIFFEWGKSASVGVQFDPMENARRIKSPPRPRYIAPVNAEGNFRFEHLPPGNYRARLRVRADATDELEPAWLEGNIWEAFPVTSPQVGKGNIVKLGLLDFEVYEAEEE
jgi:hypothetical protein